VLETVLADGIVHRRHAILRGAVRTGLEKMLQETSRTLALRRREVDEQMLELRSLRGKNANVIAGMRLRVSQEQDEFNTSEARVSALRSVHLKLLAAAKTELSSQVSLQEFTELRQVLSQSGFKLGARRAYETAFTQSIARLARVRAAATEIGAMLAASFRQLNTEFGFALQVPVAPDLSVREAEVSAIAGAHLHTVGLGHVMKLTQSGYATRLAQALGARVQTVLTDASLDLEAWSRAALSPVSVQLKERREGFERRIEAIDRIQHAASSLGERMDELQAQAARFTSLEAEARRQVAFVDEAGDVDDACEMVSTGGQPSTGLAPPRSEASFALASASASSIRPAAATTSA
jgi:hypothetical protein